MRKMILCLFFIIFLVSCDKSITGKIYIEFAGEMGYYDLDKKMFIKEIIDIGASHKYNNYDISWDNKKILLMMDVDDTFNFDEWRYVLRDMKKSLTYNDLNKGGNIIDNKYTWESISFMNAYISPNEKYIAVSAQNFSDLPITIIDISTGETISQWIDEDVEFINYGKPVWTTDNTLYFRIGANFYKCSPETGYKEAEKILDVGDATNITVNPQGTKIAFEKDKYIWMADIDGKNLRQITISRTTEELSSDGESLPVFSPDGKYIAFSSNGAMGYPWQSQSYPDGSYVVAVGGRYGYLTIIPAEGNLYDLDKKNGRILYQEKSEKIGIPVSSTPVWRK